MRAWDSVTQSGSLRAGPAALAILLAGLLLSLAPVSQRLEGTYYDLIQQLQAAAGSGQVVLVDTRDIERDGMSIWEAERFPDLLEALRRAGTRAAIVVEPPPASAALPDGLQLATLAEIERRSRNDAAAAAGSPIPDTRREAFGRELENMRRRSELQARTVRAVAAMHGMVIATPTFDGLRGATATSADCGTHGFAVADNDAASRNARRVQAAVPPPAHLCKAVDAAGHVEFWPDADGVVRRLDLLVNAPGVLIPSAALSAAMAAAEAPPATRPAVTAGSMVWGSRIIRTTDGPGALLRFYSPENAFEALSGADLLAGAASASQRLFGRLAVVGHVVPGNGEPGYVTPVSDRVPAAVMLATALSNLVDDDYLARPAWLSWVETALLVLLGMTILAWGARLPPALGLMVGVLIAALLLALEALLLLRSGVWCQFATAAAFAVFAMTAIRFLQPREQPRQGIAVVAAAAAGAGGVLPAAAPVTSEDELDLAFSMLRHQPDSDHVKQRLYDVALEHARRRDLAKAERVLRHLASIDPDFRNAGEKLKKLAGLRNAAPATPAASASPQVPPVVLPLPASQSLTGRTIGRYEIEQPIGRGAMATVYLGRDPKINRRVAIKTIALAEEFSDTDLVNARTQFLREAESAGRLNHPNIVSIYDAGEDGSVAYLAMEYFPGKALSFYAQQGQLLPPRLVFDLMARAAEALHYAHGQHVVHRDVKPANLLYDSDTDSLKITDFGIARLTDTSRTKTGIILGTPSYMSPEQLAGTNVTGQSDLFSLGITLYQLLTGMPPFRADSIPRLMQKIAHEPHESARRLREDLPACVDEILDRVLAKNPDDRYPSGRAMALALRDCCSSFEARAAVQP